MKITILGTSGAYAEAGRACSGYLIQTAKTNIWVDLGPGTLSNIQKAVKLTDLNAILISHTHPDHYLDIYGLRYYLEYDLKSSFKIKLFGPKGFKNKIISLQPESRTTFENLFDFREIDSGENFEIGDIKISSYKAHHPVDTLMYSFISEGKKIFYTADTGIFENIINAVRDSDIMLCEATYLKSENKSDVHLRTKDIAEIAMSAGVNKIVLSHFWPGTDRERSRTEVEEGFAGSVVIADENMVIEV